MFEEVKPANKTNLILIAIIGFMIFGCCGLCVGFGKFNDWFDTKFPRNSNGNVNARAK